MKLKQSFKFYESRIAGSMSHMDKSFDVCNYAELDPTGGVLVIDGVDDNGMATPSKREFVSYKSVKNGKLIGVQRGAYGSMQQAHASGAKVEAVPLVQEVKELEDRTLKDYLNALL